MRLSQTKIANNLFYVSTLNFQDLHWLCSDADDKIHRFSSYCVTNKACFNNTGASPPFLPPTSLPYSYYSVSIFCKVGVDGFIGSLALSVSIFIAQLSGTLVIDKVDMKILSIIFSYIHIL